MSATSECRATTSPYPGLRPFQTHEVDIFFGREKQTDDLLRRLKKPRSHEAGASSVREGQTDDPVRRLKDARFLAVLGPSGCGKSSLVRAGLIAELEAGSLVGAGSRWRIAEMRPGEEPLERLAKALLSPQALGRDPEGEPEAVPFVLATLRRGPHGLVKTLRERPLPEGANLLILVDQFEEIFRFRREGDANEADTFVKLLLSSAAEPSVPVYIVITMRSDFLGDCGLFKGLPEMMNDHQFLTPRLEREQSQAAIENPARVFGGAVEPPLVARLLNDMGAEPDQLPLLQHALMRMWRSACARRGGDGDCAPVISLKDYEDVGGANALSSHAQEVYDSLDEGRRRIAEVMFRRLTERAAGKRDTRRPARLDDVASVAGVEPAEVMAVVEEFRQPDRSFITPPPNIHLRPETMLDIGHESLIRQWTKLNEWVDEEEQAAASYQRLKQSAALWKKGDANLWDDIDLERARAWRTTQNPTASWASRYGSGEEYALAMKFLDASDEFDKQEKEDARQSEINRLRVEEQAKVARTLRALVAALTLLALILAGTAVWAVNQRKTAERVQHEKAQLEISQARQLQLIAEGNLASTQRLRGTADEARREADKATREASEQERRAKENAGLAKEYEAKALSQQKEAERQRQLAKVAADTQRAASAELAGAKTKLAAVEARSAEAIKKEGAALDLLVMADNTRKDLEGKISTLQKKVAEEKDTLTKVEKLRDQAIKEADEAAIKLDEAAIKLKEAQAEREVAMRQAELAQRDFNALEAERNKYLTDKTELQVKSSYFDTLRNFLRFTTVQTNRGKLSLTLVNVYGVPLNEKVDVSLENQFSSTYDVSKKHIDAAEGITFDNLVASQLGAYRLTVDSSSFLPVSNFVNIKKGETASVSLMMPFDSGKVAADLPKFEGLPAEARQLLERSEAPRDSRIKSGESLYKDLGDKEKAGLLNVIAKTQATKLSGGRTVLSYLDGLREIHPNSFFARVDKGMPDAVKASGLFKEVSSALHPASPAFRDYDLIGSFKSQSGYVKLGLTFFAKGDDVVAEVELDGVELNYAFQAVRTPNASPGAHPFDINQLLARDKVDLLYRLHP